MESFAAITGKNLNMLATTRIEFVFSVMFRSGECEITQQLGMQFM